jgi:hypothetical protein
MAAGKARHQARFSLDSVGFRLVVGVRGSGLGLGSGEPSLQREYGRTWGICFAHICTCCIDDFGRGSRVQGSGFRVCMVWGLADFIGLGFIGGHPC